MIVNIFISRFFLYFEQKKQMKTYPLILFLLVTVAGFSQASMTEEAFEKLDHYREKLTEDQKTPKPNRFSFEKIETWYCREKYNYRFDYIIDNSMKETIGIFITCVKEKNKDDKYRYLILPFGNDNLFNLFLRDKESLGLSMEENVDSGISHVLTKFANQAVNTD